MKIELKITKPLTLTMLNRMVCHVDFSHTIQVAAWAAVVLGFYLLLRKSNLVPNTVLEFSPIHQLVCKDIHFHRDLVLVNINWSKNRQIGNRVTMPLLKSKSPACPAQPIAIFFSLHQTILSHPLICTHIPFPDAILEKMARVGWL